MNCPRCGPTMGPYCPDCDLCQKCCAEECDEPPSPAPRGTSEAEITALIETAMNCAVMAESANGSYANKRYARGKAGDARSAILAHVAHLAAQRDEAVEERKDAMNSSMIKSLQCKLVAAEYAQSHAHAAGYAAAREDAANLVEQIGREITRQVNTPEWKMSGAMGHDDLAKRIRSLPSPASTEPKDPGTPKAGA